MGYIGQTITQVFPSSISVDSATVGDDLAVDTSTLKVDSTNNRVGVGTTSPDYVFEIETAENAIANFKSTDANANIRFTDSNSTANGYAGIGAIGDDLTLIAGNDNRMKIDSSGHVTMPSQPAFMATKSSIQSNIAINSVVQITFDGERFDQNGDFSSSTFTAPITGKYQFNVVTTLAELDQDSAYVEFKLETSNVTYTNPIVDPDGFDQDLPYFTISTSYLVDMDANDTAKASLYIPNGSAQTDVRSGQSFFSGYLVA